MVRPSGTEPKVKLYLFANGKNKEAANICLDALLTDMEKYLK